MAVKHWKVPFSIAAAMVFVMCTPVDVRPQTSADSVFKTRHWSGQGVAPVYEGFDFNPDGTFNLWFGYMNRNYEEELDIPVGSENTMEPGGDRGQPTHFATRRHKDVFRVVVPRDFGKQTLVWKLTVRGKIEVVTGTLNPVWQIDRRRTTRGGNDEAMDSNTPPTVNVQPPVQTITLPGTATLNVSATDDGLPKRWRRGGPSDGPALKVDWLMFRGPAEVTFKPSDGWLTDGKATTIVSFAEPGEYVLQAVIDDGSGELSGDFGYHCCWTNAEVRVSVKAR